jgi:mediator of RNA polymerase II transcription subunit 8
VEANEEARRRNWGGDYTLEEKAMGLENVVTGLRRKLVEDEEEESEESEEEEEEGQGEEMEIVGVHRRAGGAGTGVEFDISREGNHAPPKAVPPAVPLEEMLRFMMTGVRHR